MRRIISRKQDLKRACFSTHYSTPLLLYFPIMSHNVKAPFHNPGPVQSLLSLDIYVGSQSAGLCMVGSTYYSALYHKSSLDRLCTLNRHISHITSQGIHGTLRHPSAVSRLNANDWGRQMDPDQTRSKSKHMALPSSMLLNTQNSSCYEV